MKRKPKADKLTKSELAFVVREGIDGMPGWDQKTVAEKKQFIRDYKESHG
ncbi:MAG: hypothetical protein Q8K86_10680 [Candidatus Nanopelagicaceae bacterium]|nr:hypothetical protein [Candidatus Nanopelagicaceae bacterium]